jgi:Fimbrillin-A associated anchor proteins Mfa1 and Mfa2
MEKNNILSNCISAICTILAITSFVSCSADADSVSSIDNNVALEAEAPFSVVLKAYSDSRNITSNGDVDNTTLFVFDQNNDFYKQITIDRTYLLQAKPVEISCPGAKKITVVAWAGISNSSEEISNMNQANIISDLQVSLKQNNGVASALPGDLFYGQVTINRPATKTAAQELKIERKVSSLSLLTKGILKMYDSKEGNYFYKIKRTKSTFNHNGELTGTELEYIIPATVNNEGYLVAQKIVILPTSDIVIELYKDNKMILSSENCKNAEKVAVNAGEQFNFVFDLSRNNMNVIVSQWGTIVQNVTVG